MDTPPHPALEQAAPEQEKPSATGEGVLGAAGDIAGAVAVESVAEAAVETVSAVVGALFSIFD